MEEKLIAQLAQLADITTRMDERLKSIKDKQIEIDQKIEDVLHKHNSLLERVLKLEANDNEELFDDVKAIDKRLSSIEYVSGGFENKWKTFSSYVIHLIWIVIACWVLMKLNLTTPPIP
jgi:predicted nuclease with TOPRIM domain